MEFPNDSAAEERQV